MANMCYNAVIFSGAGSKIQEAKALFSEIQAKEERDNKIWLPEFVTEKDGHMVDVYIKDGTVHYRTWWSPNLNTLVQIADHFNLDFANKYTEPGMRLFGWAVYKDQQPLDMRLCENDFRSITYESENEQFIYDGRAYDDDWPIFEQILELKIAADPDYRSALQQVQQNQHHLNR